MNQFLQKMKDGLARFMQGRYGTDQLGMCTLIAGLVCSLIASFTGIPLLSFLGLALYVITVFRMLSRNREARMKENQKYLQLTGDIPTRVRQFFKRLQNSREYKYFRCPNCKVLLRLKRGCGEKEITCVRCGHHFNQKA
ncbi:MAG: hypothetical protein IJI21_10285 [Clostridia bacterium]|nr:hypothetical protein [Clostridia bacterium]